MSATTFNLADLMEDMADTIPDRLALVCGDRKYSFAQLDERATRLARHWRSLGLGPGDHVGLYLYNRAEYIECMLAAFKLGAVTININYRYVAAELAYVVDNAQLVGLVCEPELASEVEATGAQLRFVTVLGEDYESGLGAQSSVRDFAPRTGEELWIIYTGGTTGMPRGVMWRHQDLFFAALQGGNPGGDPHLEPERVAAQAKKNGEGLNVHPAAPLIHGAAMLGGWIAMLSGGTAVYVEGRGFHPEQSLTLAERYDCSAINLVGDAMARPLADCLAAHPGRWNLGMLNAVASAGAILSASVREQLEELLPNTMVLNNFGASETGHQGTAFYEGGEAIWVMDEEHTCVLNDRGQKVQTGEVGMLARFGHIPLGYFGDEEKTARTFKTFDGVRYVIPGDMATVDEEGSVVFLGRGAVCINSGGEKVYPEEVEEALKGHPAIFDAVVVGVPDERWGQRVEAVVTVRPGMTVDLPSVDAHCRSLVAGYKTPRRIHVVDDLNRHPSGKPDYAWARAHAEGV